jgi:YVTN family beta-propeller protein
MITRFRLLRLIAVSAAFLVAVAAYGQFGQLQKTYPGLFGREFVLHPTQPYIYTTMQLQDSIAIINTNTLALEKVVPIGSVPQGLAISPDGNRLYVANSNSNLIGVLDTNARTTLPSIPVPENPRDVEVGGDGRLFVLGTNSIMQVNPTTGAAAGPNVGGAYGGELEISPNKDRLYYGDSGLSPSSLSQFDITVNPPVLLWQGTAGSNGQDLDISHDGNFISYTCGAGMSGYGYTIAKFRTSDMAIVGRFNTDAYPHALAFSPDDAVTYTVHRPESILVWDANTFASLGTIHVAGSNLGGISEMLVDRTGRHLFAQYSDSYHGIYELRVYDTGRTVPEPAGATLALIGLIGASQRRLGCRNSCYLRLW